MNYTTMTRLFPAAAALAELKGTPFQRMTELLKERRQALIRLMSALSGEDAMHRGPAATASALARSLSEGGMLFLQAVCAAGPEKTCTVLYRYRPEDPEALFFLLKRQQKEDFSVHYIADALRLLALSKLKQGTSYPTLTECLSDKPKEPEKTGAEILTGILSAALGEKGEHE